MTEDGQVKALFLSAFAFAFAFSFGTKCSIVGPKVYLFWGNNVEYKLSCVM